MMPIKVGIKISLPFKEYENRLIEYFVSSMKYLNDLQAIDNTEIRLYFQNGLNMTF